MIFEQCNDIKKLENICKKSGSDRVKQSANYLRTAKFRSKDKFVAEIAQDCGFYAGTFAKEHFNLLDMAVLENLHGKGIGKSLTEQMKRRCIEKGVHKIRLRTSIEETAVDFWQKQGAKIVGLKENDYVMEIDL